MPSRTWINPIEALAFYLLAGLQFEWTIHYHHSDYKTTIRIHKGIGTFFLGGGVFCFFFYDGSIISSSFYYGGCQMEL